MTAAAVPQPGGEPNPPCAAEGAPNGGYGGHPSTGGRGGAKIFCWWRRLSPASASDHVDVPPGPSALWKPVNHGRNGRALRWRPVEVQGSLPGSAPTGKGASGRILCCPCGGAGGSFCVQVTRRIPPSDVRQRGWGAGYPGTHFPAGSSASLCWDPPAPTSRPASGDTSMDDRGPLARGVVISVVAGERGAAAAGQGSPPAA